MSTAPHPTLQTTPLCEVLAHALHRSLSGSLHLNAGRAGSHIVVLREGAVTKIESPSTEDRLGSLLLQTAHLSRSDLAQALATSRKLREPLGQRLVEEGLVEESQVHSTLDTQRTARLSEICRLPKTTRFVFRRNKDDLASWQPLAGEPYGTLSQCVDTEDLAARVAAMQNTFGACTLRLTPLPQLASMGLHVTAEPWLQSLTRGSTLGELQRQWGSEGKSSAKGLHLALYKLLLVRALTVTRRPSRRAAAAQHTLPARRLSAHECAERILEAIGRKQLPRARTLAEAARGQYPRDALLRGCGAWLEACLAEASQRPAVTETSLHDLNLCIHKLPDEVHLRRYRADLLRRIGREDEAIVDLSWITRNDPADLDAKRELRLYKQRRSRSSKTRSSWSRLLMRPRA